MCRFLIIVAVFVACAIAGSVIAWPLYTLFEPWQQVPFDRFVKWCAILAIAVTTAAVLRQRSVQRAEIGFAPASKPAWLLLSTGLIAGLALIALPAISLYLLDIRTFETHANLSHLAGTLFLSVLPTAIMVALIEETYFRGIQYEALARQRHMVAAVLLPAVFYAGVHFLNVRATASVTSPEWFYGLTLLLEAPVQVCRTSDCIGAAATLLAAGIFLGLVRARGSHLLTCIGVHAGWIIGIKMTKKLTRFDADADLAFLAGGTDRFTGILTALWLAAACVWAGASLVHQHRKKRRRHAAAAAP